MIGEVDRVSKVLEMKSKTLQEIGPLHQNSSASCADARLTDRCACRVAKVSDRLHHLRQSSSTLVVHTSVL